MSNELVIKEGPDTIKISKGGTSFSIELALGEPTVKRRVVELPNTSNTLKIDDDFLYFSNHPLFISMDLDEGDAEKILDAIKGD